MKKKLSHKLTEQKVAAFMKRRLAEERDLYQEVIVHEIEEKFGSTFVYQNENGNPAIIPSVLREFRRLTPDIVWVRGERYWRLREESDDPDSRMQE